MRKQLIAIALVGILAMTLASTTIDDAAADTIKETDVKVITMNISTAEKTWTNEYNYSMTFAFEQGSSNEKIFLNYIYGKSTIVPTADDRSTLKIGQKYQEYCIDYHSKDWTIETNNVIIKYKMLVVASTISFSVQMNKEISLTVDYGKSYYVNSNSFSTYSMESGKEFKTTPWSTICEFSINANEHSYDISIVSKMFTTISYEIDGVTDLSSKTSSLPIMIVCFVIGALIMAVVFTTVRCPGWAR